ncbi:MAG: PorT family protein [Muribaculaceae bacterium]|nr:PorT family protein [Muribaculaceae bacterium]
MKRKILISIFTLFLGVVCCFAQDNSVIWGIKASVDAELPSKWHRDGGSVTMYRPGYGFTIGGVSNIYLGKNFYFEPGISLAYSQYRYKDIVFSDSQGVILETDPKIYKWSFQIPLVVGYTIDLSDKYYLNVFTGPQIRYAFAGDISFKNKEIEEDANEFINLWNGQRRFDLSWKIGVGMPVNNFLISLEAELGITDLLKNDMSFRENRVGVGITYYF